jgi:hypothetical protein
LNPIDIFGTDCKYLFNPENSVWNGSNYVNTDAVNNVVATSSNMVESSLKYRAPNLSYSQNMIETNKVCDNKYIKNFLKFNGIDKYMTMPTTNLDPNIFGGTNNKYTIYATIESDNLSGYRYIIEGNGQSFALVTNGSTVSLITNNNLRTLKSGSVITLNKIHHISISVDLENTSNSKIVIDGEEVVLSINDLTSTTNAPTSYDIARRSNNTYFLDGGLFSLSVVNRVTTIAEDLLMYNNGVGANPYNIFNTDCKLFLSADKTVWDGSNLEITDDVSLATATSVNMIESDLIKSPNSPY